LSIVPKAGTPLAQMRNLTEKQTPRFYQNDGRDAGSGKRRVQSGKSIADRPPLGYSGAFSIVSYLAPRIPAGAFCCKSSPMSNRKALAREIAARTTPRFIEIKVEKQDRRPIMLWTDDVRRAENVRKRLARLLEE
jgi:hypothetical protein